MQTLGQLFVDSLFVTRFLWFYYKAPTRVERTGFHTHEEHALPFKQRVSWAWAQAKF